jgi:hypothetical protein
MIEQPDLFSAPPRPLPPPPPPFDPHSHPCVVCGAELATFGRGWPHEPKFYCRQHYEVPPMTAAAAIRNADDLTA